MKHKTIQEFAEKNAVPFYDFNEGSLFDEIDYNVESRIDETYDRRRVYEHRIKNIQMTEVTDINEYLNLISDDNYSIFAFGGTNIGEYIDDLFMSNWVKLGNIQ